MQTRTQPAQRKRQNVSPAKVVPAENSSKAGASKSLANSQLSQSQVLLTQSPPKDAAHQSHAAVDESDASQTHVRLNSLREDGLDSRASPYERVCASAACFAHSDENVAALVHGVQVSRVPPEGASLRDEVLLALGTARTVKACANDARVAVVVLYDAREECSALTDAHYADFERQYDLFDDKTRVTVHLLAVSDDDNHFAAHNDATTKALPLTHEYCTLTKLGAKCKEVAHTVLNNNNNKGDNDNDSPRERVVSLDQEASFGSAPPPLIVVLVTIFCFTRDERGAAYRNQKIRDGVRNLLTLQNKSHANVLVGGCVVVNKLCTSQDETTRHAATHVKLKQIVDDVKRDAGAQKDTFGSKYAKKKLDEQFDVVVVKEGDETKLRIALFLCLLFGAYGIALGAWGLRETSPDANPRPDPTNVYFALIFIGMAIVLEAVLRTVMRRWRTECDYHCSAFKCISTYMSMAILVCSVLVGVYIVVNASKFYLLGMASLAGLIFFEFLYILFLCRYAR